jgi:hypothetical protein
MRVPNSEFGYNREGDHEVHKGHVVALAKKFSKVLNIMVSIKIRRLGWADHVMGVEDERIQKSFFMGNFIIQDQWENQEQDGRYSSGGTHHKF